jgi:putative transposase
MAYSEDLRQRVLHYVDTGGSKTQAAQLFQVGLRTVHVWQSQGSQHQRGKPGPRGSRKFDRNELAKMVQKQPDLLLKEMAARLGVSINTVHHALKCMGISRKKNTAVRPSLRAPTLR